ncbi:bleomycin resistance family protein [Arcobacter suis]|mgnify:CR=1 FL=1|uniref:Glyoxalase/bleomycin resistance protein n=1 Tax=Arcobacter suis CECT 7833 TaxID=663365 RepID=A0AAD0SQV6_9BACT|nr:VOC family protein [Arcobacter suis]AXX89991.1 putative glyoxalase/bleomycin resistance protein [Arcobacter suis CECT 7833]RWS47126.1 bleomycin resistance family protein [Arcobacter suis]
MKSITLNLAVNDIASTIKYYQENFDFELQMLVDESKTIFDTEIKKELNYIWAMIHKDNISIMLQSVESLKEDVGVFFDNIGASLTLYIDVENVDELYLKIKDKVSIYKEIDTTWYGQREFYIKDINGYILGFASKKT